MPLCSYSCSVGSFEFAVVAAAVVAVAVVAVAVVAVAVVVAGIETVCTLVGTHSANDYMQV